MPILPYDRRAAVQYAHQWAFSRNPAYFDFSSLGGDCTNFCSQCLFAGSRVMNYTPVTGWYYRSSSDRTASWTGVQFLYNFLVGNRGAGPQGTPVSIFEAQPGDVLQLGDGSGRFYHSPVIVSVGSPADPTNVLVAAHTNDADNRPLSTYRYGAVRFIHIAGVQL